jgi:acetyltransferase-like isoleucine patch superfamily enzyme
MLRFERPSSFEGYMTASFPASIASSAQIDPSTSLGAFCFVGEQVLIGKQCQIGHHVVIHDGTVIGDHVRIDDHATLGKQPMRALNSAFTGAQAQPPLVVGDGCLIGAGAVLYAGCRLDRHVLVADLATVREEVTVGAYTIIGRGVAVENQCTIGRYCKLETNAYLTAYSTIEDRVFVAPGVLTSNDNFIGRTAERFKHFAGVTIRKGGRVGVGAVVLPGIEIAPDSLLAAGGLATHDTEPRSVFAGVPARRFKDVPTDQLLENQGWEDAP